MKRDKGFRSSTVGAFVLTVLLGSLGCQAAVNPSGDLGLRDGVVGREDLQRDDRSGMPKDSEPSGSCVGMVCDTPPPPTCVDGKTLASFAAKGICAEGSCVYAKKTEICPGRCVAGGCLLATTILYVDGKNGGEEKGTRSAPFRTIMTAVKIAKSITA
ncbi:MAG: hypothetical protein KAI47_16620, partial [Deltaproteobacteria bacterium]|nr:hypothetical protein [Deltaproteobacteria bacterium]